MSTAIYRMPEFADINLAQPGYLVRVSKFPDGELGIEVPADDKSDDALLFGACHNAEASEAMLATAYELAQRHDSVFVVIAYFRNARSERRTSRETVVMAKLQARLWSGLGSKAHIHMVEPHSDLIENYFTGVAVTQDS